MTVERQALDPLTLPLWGSRLIEASAGTGKTWTIAALYLRLVLGHGDAGESDAGTRSGAPLVPSQILVMTFTRAATRELVERIRERLVRAARWFRDPHGSAGADPFVDRLIDACPDAAARDVAAWRLAAAAEAMDDAGVFTIDAWIGRMLREHAFDSGSLFDEAMQADETAMLAEAVRDYWRQEVYPLRGAALDDALRAWPTLDDLAADVRLFARHVRLDDDGSSLAARREPIAARRDAALAEIKARWSRPIGTTHEWLTSQLCSPTSAFHRNKLRPKTVDGWYDALTSWLATPAQVEPFPAIKRKERPAVWRRLSAAGLRECVKDGRQVDVPDAFDALSALPAALAPLEDPTHAMRLHAAARVATRLRTLKERAGVHGFQDLLERLDRALHGTGGERLRARIVAQYPVAMIDEFQDTSPLQNRVFDRLYRTADNARDTALLLIGDPKQSIYAFRGADIQSYLAARRATTGRHYLLTTNHRSQPALVATVNRLFGAAEGRGDGAFRFGATGSSEPSPLPFVPVDAVRRDETLVDARGPVAACVVCHDAELAPHDHATRRFAERAAEHVATSLTDPQVGFVDAAGVFRRLAPADIAVLVRNRKEAAAIRGALQRRGIASAYLSDQESVFASREAGDLLHWLRAVADPLDGRRARLAFATGLIGLSLAELAALRDDDRVFEMRVDQLRLLHREWSRQGVLPMIRRTLHLLDLPARWLDMPDGERRLTNVLHLAELMQQASMGFDRGHGPEALIRWLEEHVAADHRDDDQQVVRLESDADLVRVVTIHKAKGLEYAVVYLPFVCGVREKRWQDRDVAFPADADGVRRVEFDASEDTRRRIDLEDRQEDLRLLYVALTRARHALWVGVAPIRFGRDPACGFHRSAFGYLLTGGEPVDADAVAGLLERTFADLPSVVLEAVVGDAPCTRLPRADRSAPLRASPNHPGGFERDWSIASFSSLVRDLTRLPARAGPVIDPALAEEVLSGPLDEDVADAGDARPAREAARHRFPRGALAGNFLHDQLEWLAGERFAVDRDPTLEHELLRRCDRQGWSLRGADVATWMREIVTTTLPPLGMSLARLPRILPEMEFWFPGARVDAADVDRLCRAAWLDGRERPPLPERALRGMLMGFVDLVCEIDGRYWLIDYKSNALGERDADYDAEAIARSMADHRYDVQGSIYLLALHRLLARRLGDRYDPATQLGGALYLYLRGIEGPVAGCHVMTPDVAWLAAFDALFAGAEAVGP